LQSYALIFDIGGERWEEVDGHPSPESVDAYAKVRLQVVVEERKPPTASIQVFEVADDRRLRGAWTFEARRSPAIVWEGPPAA